ncbi:MAG: protoporphyrinogen/coproporphyrinogen oxidase [Myxococcota bacterium]
MERTRYLVIGAGVTGLSFADWVDSDDYLVCEALDEIGGYCRTIRKDGFVWDFSGHFFHFRNKDVEEYLVARMGDQEIRTVVKDARIWFDGRLVDFPFQKNIHQLPRQDFIDCLVDLYFKDEAAPSDRPPANFEEMLYAKFGRGIAERFLIPYNEKLYATDLSSLDVDAMGRFFPWADVPEIIGNFRRADNRSYNATFTYPEGGAIQYVRALAEGVDEERILFEEPVLSIDLERKVARTPKREIAFEYCVSSTPFPKLLQMTGLPHEPATYDWNKVLVFNLGFDRKGPEGIHWMYFPSKEQCFYRVGFYDNIFGTDRMSMYVEIGYPAGAPIDDEVTGRMLERTLEDLRACGIVDGHRLVAQHSVVLDPAYVHITGRSNGAVARHKRTLAHRGVHAAGRYGSWTYCSIEDNILEARALADSFNVLDGIRG